MKVPGKHYFISCLALNFEGAAPRLQTLARNSILHKKQIHVKNYQEFKWNGPFRFSPTGIFGTTFKGAL